MLSREQIIKILDRAKSIDSNYELFGASKHKYKLNPPIRASFVHGVEERYGFTLPDDYFRFITEVGDGGAGPDYGIEEFTDLLRAGKNPINDKYLETYRHSLSKPFTVRPLMADELEEYAIATKEAYEKNPDRYFVYERTEESDSYESDDGYYILGTHGCQWDFGLVISGERRGKVFDTYNEGAYCLVANSFDEYYQNWLDHISDTEKLKKELERWKNILRRKK